jgi:hypothetical protein
MFILEVERMDRNDIMRGIGEGNVSSAGAL